VKDWFREGASRDARYEHLYNEFELFELTERVRQIAEQAEQTFVITNNHYRGQAVCNALEIKAKLGEKTSRSPKSCYPITHSSRRFGRKKSNGFRRSF